MKFDSPEPAQISFHWLKDWSKSGTMTPTLIALLCLGLAIGSYEHTRGNLHKLRETVANKPDIAPAATGPGGQDPVKLTRQTSANATDPEFLSATLLPGRGFNLWQITAFLPGRGEVPLLISPNAAETLNLLSGQGTDSNGSASTDFGGAFLAPWAAQITGGPAPGTGILQSQWQGQRLSFPAQAAGSTLSTEGLLLDRGADTVKTASIPDGQSADASFRAGTFSGDWPGDTDLSIHVELSGHTIDLVMTARNNGTVPEPFGMGWHPYFAIPSGNRSDARLVIPSITRLDPPDRHTGLSSGNVTSATNTPFDFVRASGTRLGTASVDETYIDLHSPVLADGPIAELHDPDANYGLRIIPLTTNIKTLHVVAPAGKPWVSIGPNMNVPDPFGHEWDHIDNTGMVILQPGDSVQWKVRLEIFSLARSLAASYGQ